MKDYTAWLVLFIVGIILIVSGFQGSFGRILACAVCPNKLEVTGNA